MKKLFFIFLLIYSLESNAQVSFGLHGGLLATGNRYYHEMANSDVGARFGAEVLIRLYKGFHLRTGLDYTRYNFDQELTYIDQNARDIYKKRQNVHIGYLGVPIGLRYSIGQRAFAPFGEVSISVMQKVSDRVAGTDHPPFHYKANDTQISPAMAAGFSYRPVKYLYVSMQVGLNAQFLAVYNFTPKVYYRALSAGISLGYRFGSKE